MYKYEYEKVVCELGGWGVFSGNEQEHYQNYMIILRLFILIIIKINDELCVLDSEDYKSSQN